MHSYDRRNKTAGSSPQSIVTVKASKEGAAAIKRILERIQEVGGVGHSFGIIEQDPPDGEPVVLGGWDGDGSCWIHSIDVEDIKS